MSFQSSRAVEDYARETKLRWPVVIDETRSLYRAYGMERGRFWRVWGTASWGSYIKLLLRGRRLKKPSGDVHQLGGDVLIDPHGIVRLQHVSRVPADRPAVLSILAVVRQVTGGLP